MFGQRKTEPHPTAVLTTRRDPMHTPAHFEQWAPSVAPGAVANVPEQERPLPIEQSAFWPLGKTFDHAWSHVRVQHQLAISEWTSVIGWPFLPGMRAEPGSMVVYQPIGGQNTIGQRVNVNPPGQARLSDLSEVPAPQTIPTNPVYLKLM